MRLNCQLDGDRFRLMSSNMFIIFNGEEEEKSAYDCAAIRIKYIQYIYIHNLFGISFARLLTRSFMSFACFGSLIQRVKCVALRFITKNYALISILYAQKHIYIYFLCVSRCCSQFFCCSIYFDVSSSSAVAVSATTTSH